MNGDSELVGEAWRNRQQVWRRWLSPPLPVYPNPREKEIEVHYPLGKWNLYVGGAGNHVPGYVNIDLFGLPRVDLVCSVEALPFRDNVFARVECDAVLEHVENPNAAVDEIHRCLKGGGLAHFVVPFCHPFHEYPRDFRRYTPDGIRRLLREFEIVDTGWRSGPTATWLVFTLEYVKSWFRSKWWRRLTHFALGWVLFPLRYLDALLFRLGDLQAIGNHHYAYAVKTSAAAVRTGERSR